MSIRVMTAVWEGSRLVGTDLLMLLALADFSDDDGISYPSVAKLAKKCRTTPRHANRLITALVAAGELEVLAGRGPAVQGGRLNLYRVQTKVLLEAAKEMTGVSGVTDSSGVTPASGRGDTQGRRGDVEVPEGVTPTSVKPSLNRQRNRQEPSGGSRSASRGARAPGLPDPKILFPEVTEQVLSDFVRGRKQKLTETAAKLLRTQAGKAGLSMQEALELCCAKGWQSIDAEWDSVKQAVASKARGARDFTRVDYTEGLKR